MNAPLTGFWLSDASVPLAEILASLDFDFVVLDIEHGVFDLAILERFIPVLKGLGLEVWAKTLAPRQDSIQQPLDFGADGVIIPHVDSFERAERVTAHAKYAPVGDRSLAGGRAYAYEGWSRQQTDAYNAQIMCYPLIEHPGAVRDIEKIAALPTVDGFQIGTSDLALTSGRDSYSQSEEDWNDIERCVAAFNNAGKPWLFPAWTESEQKWALENGARRLMIGVQYHWIKSALRQAKEQFDLLPIQDRLLSRN